ncbi:MAG: hypothetical protein RH949_13295 [Coleofasciculus sp. A1-SPW-01]|uniref:hypothetical protein n=1 Tax=Coleofasciculus sp. A1-SPW-01 TaxID=3070819 RepID=UPI0032F8551B
MASTFVSGGGEMTATTEPAAMLEIAQNLVSKELLVPVDTRPGNITITTDHTGTTTTISATIPITTTLSGGQSQLAARNYFTSLGVDATFDPGTSGTLSNNTVPAAFWEMALTLQESEEVVQVDGLPNNISITVDYDAEIATVDVNLPVTQVIAAAGSVTTAAVDYL